MILRHRLTIRLNHTDAAGLIFFPRLFELVQETLEIAMKQRGAPIVERLASDGPIMPIAHCEADFRRPLRLGDEVDVEMTCERIGDKSLTFAYRFLAADGAEAARARTVHVAMDRRTGAPMPLTEAMRRLAESAE
ncbi:acyl-CoA thioesterase [bacterium]|nr:acyl-CoA thioesterase [bacterium]